MKNGCRYSISSIMLLKLICSGEKGRARDFVLFLRFSGLLFQEIEYFLCSTTMSMYCIWKSVPGMRSGAEELLRYKYGRPREGWIGEGSKAIATGRARDTRDRASIATGRPEIRYINVRRSITAGRATERWNSYFGA